MSLLFAEIDEILSDIKTALETIVERNLTNPQEAVVLGAHIKVNQGYNPDDIIPRSNKQNAKNRQTKNYSRPQEILNNGKNKKKYMWVFMNGKQVRVKRPETIDGVD